MAQDRIITWNQKAGRRPSANRITAAVKAFFGPRGPRVETDADRLYIAYSKDHWIEVALTPGEIDVITRQVDAKTRDKANDLARHLAKQFNGDYDDPIHDQVWLVDDDDMMDDGGFV
jgi:hypothetical protein